MVNNNRQGSIPGNQQVKSVSTLFSILEHLKENQGMGVTELSRELEMSKGSVHRYLKTLVDVGYAVNNDGTYDLGLRFLDFGSYVRDQYPFNEFIHPKTQQLAEETGERSQYLVKEHGRGIYLHRERGEHAVKTDARVGKVVYLHTTAAGKAILSEMPREQVDEIIDRHGLIEQTKNTITEREQLYETLDQIREQGYALNEEEHVQGLVAVGVPINHPDGYVLGGMSVSGPATRIKDRIEDRTIPRMLLGTADEIELNLNYS